MFKSFVCALALATTATAANAESLSIQTGDLNLATEAGQKKLDQRITAAARKICGANEPNTGTRVAPKSSGECVRRTVTEARAKFAATATQQTS